VVDATEPLTAQDQHIAGYVREAGKGMIVVVNKWDLVEKTPTTMNEYTALAARELNFMPYVPVLFVSARTKQRVYKIVDEALRIEAERKKRIPTAQLNTTVQAALREHPPLSSKGKLLKIKYVTQAATDPPTFVFFVNDPELVHFSYERFLENKLRAAFGFEGTAVRLVFRSTRATAKQSEGAAPRRLRA
jgi:GTP-binding protein